MLSFSPTVRLGMLINVMLKKHVVSSKRNTLFDEYLQILWAVTVGFWPAQELNLEPSAQLVNALLLINQ